MFKEIAFDPMCMAQMEYYNLLKQHFGFNRGRYVSAELKPWVQEAMNHVKKSNLQPVKQKSIKNYLNNLSREKQPNEFLLTEYRKGVTAKNWLDWFSQQQKKRAFSLSISESAEIPSIKMDDINENHTDWIVPASISISATAAEIVSSLTSLFNISKSVLIVDQFYVMPNNKALNLLLVELQNTNVKKITIVSAINPNKPDLVYKMEYEKINKSTIKFCWIVAPEKFFHDRYFITDVGAVRSGNGFSELTVKGAHADLLNLNLIDKGEADRTRIDLDHLIKLNKASVIFSN